MTLPTSSSSSLDLLRRPSYRAELKPRDGLDTVSGGA
jgi:hypothetical protein